MTTALTKPGPETYDAKGVALAGNRPNQRGAVDGIGDGAIDHLFDANFRKGWHTGDCPFQHIHNPVQVIRAQIIAEFGINPIHAPGLATLFIKPD